jgi:hypothetical protein
MNNNFTLYPMEYRLTRCLVCSEPIENHKRFTAEDIEAVKGATFEKPINGYRSPLSPKLIGEWKSHEPMEWPERIAMKQKERKQ